MKTLGLLRHAKSDWDDLNMRDFDRGLNDRGRKGARLIGRHIREHGTDWDVLLASPAERVKRTLEAALPDLEAVFHEQLYLADVPTILDILQGVSDDTDAVLLAGHNPGLQELLFTLVPPQAENAEFDAAATKYPTATFAVFELAIERWADLSSDCGRLVHFKRPRDLDPALGPDS